MKYINKLLILIIIIIPVIVKAEDITKETNVTVNGNVLNKLVDSNYNTYININKNEVININNDNTLIDGIYIVYELKGYKGTIKYNDESKSIGDNFFVHEYIKLDKPTNNIEISYMEDAIISDIYILSKGDIPDYVEDWNTPCKEADLLFHF